MAAYHLALFIHILAVIVAAGVTAVTKLAVGRRIRARTVGEALEWHKLLMSSSRLYPICLAVFVLSGGYMMSVIRVSVWTTGFILAGLIGVVLLLASGIYLGTRGKAFQMALEGMAANGADQPLPRMAPPPLVMVLPMVNTGIALAVAFVMVMKTISLPISLGVVAIGIVLGALAAPRPPKAAMARAAAAAEL